MAAPLLQRRVTQSSVSHIHRKGSDPTTFARCLRLRASKGQTLAVASVRKMDIRAFLPSRSAKGLTLSKGYRSPVVHRALTRGGHSE